MAGRVTRPGLVRISSMRPRAAGARRASAAPFLSLPPPLPCFRCIRLAPQWAALTGSVGLFQEAAVPGMAADLVVWPGLSFRLSPRSLAAGAWRAPLRGHRFDGLTVCDRGGDAAPPSSGPAGNRLARNSLACRLSGRSQNSPRTARGARPDGSPCRRATPPRPAAIARTSRRNTASTAAWSRNRRGRSCSGSGCRRSPG
jgi:hypothetical protein